jgi:glycosyltransferase involved in cell wall biosynthesis
MRIGFDARWLSVPEPVAYNRYIVNLLRGLQREHGVELFLFTDEGKSIHDRHLCDLGVTVITLPGRRELFWEQVELPLALRKNRIQVYHAPADGGVPAVKVCGYVLTRHSVPHRLYFKRALKRRQLHGSLEDYLGDVKPDHPRLRGLYLRARGNSLRWVSFHQSDLVITVSETTKRELTALSGLPEQNLRVTHLAPDGVFRTRVAPAVIEQARRKYGLPAGYVLSVGTVARIKNTAGLLRVHSAVKQAGGSQPLVICAPTTHNLEYYKALAAQLGLQEQKDVFFLIGVGADLPALYQGATLFILLSWYESFSLPVTEAMACGLPIVASHSACLPEIVGNGGILVDPQDIGQVALIVKQVLDSAHMQEELRGRALRRSLSFSWEKTAQQTFEVYKEVMNLQRKRTGS